MDFFQYFFSKCPPNSKVENANINSHFLHKCNVSRRKTIKYDFSTSDHQIAAFRHFLTLSKRFFRFFQLRHIKNSRLKADDQKTFFYYFSTHQVMSISHNTCIFNHGIIVMKSIIFTENPNIPQYSSPRAE